MQTCLNPPDVETLAANPKSIIAVALAVSMVSLRPSGDQASQLRPMPHFLRSAQILPGLQCCTQTYHWLSVRYRLPSKSLDMYMCLAAGVVCHASERNSSVLVVRTSRIAHADALREKFPCHNPNFVPTVSTSDLGLTHVKLLN